MSSSSSTPSRAEEASAKMMVGISVSSMPMRALPFSFDQSASRYGSTSVTLALPWSVSVAETDTPFSFVPNSV